MTISDFSDKLLYTMIIDLTKIPSYWLTCQKTANRWPRMEEMLKNLEISAHMVDGAMTTPYTLGVAQSNIEVLEKHLEEPVLLLEDDIVTLPAYRDIIDVPDNVDALFLGTSHYGRRFGQTQLGGVVSKNIGDYLRVYNMLSLHAVVYISRRYKEHVINLLKNFNGIGGVDDLLVDNCDDFKLLAVKEPFWYQDDGHSAEQTKQKINPIF